MTPGPRPALRSVAGLGVLLLVGGALGCGGARLRSRVDAARRVVDSARASGARTCAPVQLAMAESHLEFADLELDEGDYYRARHEVAVAETNAREALRRSPRGRCGGDRDKDGILDGRDQCPTRAEDLDKFEDDDGCPEADNDNDGLADAVDGCPSQPEDRDGFEDDDGCPDDDNDKDKLGDRADQCPDQAEDPDGHQDDDGCPDCDDDGDKVLECPEPLDKCPGQAGRPTDGCPYKNVVVTDTRIQIKEAVYFATGKARIRDVSFGLLDEVAQALQDNPTIVIRIEGHTDSQGRDARNLRLSRARAASVRAYLLRRSVSGDRMMSEGYGEARPISDNRTASGRAENRRVEFVITDR